MRVDPNDMPRIPRRPSRASAQRLREAVMALTEGKAELLRHRETSWASITFSGTRHHLELRFSETEGIEAAERFIEALPEHEFTIPRQIVADAAIRNVKQAMLPQPELLVAVELLLLEEE